MRISISWKREEPFFFISKAGFLIFFSIAKMSKKSYRFALEMCQKCLMKCLAHNRGTFSYFSFSVILGAKVSILSWKTNPFPTFLLQNVQARKKSFSHYAQLHTWKPHTYTKEKAKKVLINQSWMINGTIFFLFCLRPVDQLNENDYWGLNYSETLNCAQQIWKGGGLRTTTSFLESFSVLSKCTTIICLSQHSSSYGRKWDVFWGGEEADSYVINVVMILIYLEKSTFKALENHSKSLILQCRTIFKIQRDFQTLWGYSCLENL